MANMLGDAVAWLQGLRGEFLGEPIRYERGGLVSLDALQATPGQTEFEIETSETIRVESRSKDWIVTASHLVDRFGRVILPERGDRITARDGQYEVMAPGNVQPYRLDPTGQQLRIHSRKVSSCV